MCIARHCLRPCTPMAHMVTQKPESHTCAFRTHVAPDQAHWLETQPDAHTLNSTQQEHTYTHRATHKTEHVQTTVSESLSEALGNGGEDNKIIHTQLIIPSKKGRPHGNVSFYDYQSHTTLLSPTLPLKLLHPRHLLTLNTYSRHGRALRVQPEATSAP